MRLKRNTLAMGAIFLTLPLFGMAQSQNNNDAAPVNQEARSQAAAEMVSADATLLHNLDANKIQPNSTIQVKLNTTVHLNDGTKLPSGTILVGHIVQDQTAAQGNGSSLAFNFNQAQMKDGKKVPITATLVGVSPDANRNVGYIVAPGNKWTNGPLQIDQVGVLKGVDLHSRIDGSNSGVLVSTDKSDLKLRQGSGLQFAIGAAGANQASS